MCVTAELQALWGSVLTKQEQEREVIAGGHSLGWGGGQGGQSRVASFLATSQVPFPVRGRSSWIWSLCMTYVFLGTFTPASFELVSVSGLD